MAVITACLPTFQILLRKTSTEAVSQGILGFFSLKSLSSLAQRFTGATNSNMKHKDCDASSTGGLNETFSMEMKFTEHPYMQVEEQRDPNPK